MLQSRIWFGRPAIIGVPPYPAPGQALRALQVGRDECTCACGAAADSRLADGACSRLRVPCNRLLGSATLGSVTVELPPSLPSLLLPLPVMPSSVAFAGPINVSDIAWRNTASSVGFEALSKPARQATIQPLGLRQACMGQQHTLPVSWLPWRTELAASTRPGALAAQQHRNADAILVCNNAMVDH